MYNAELNNLMQALSALSVDEQKSLVSRIMDMMNSADEKNTCNSMVKEYTFKDEKPDCPHCKAQAKLGYVVKKGFKKGVQRFYCKACGHFFVPTTNTAFEKSRKSPEVWEKFIQMTIAGSSLKTCASECEIAYQTAFTWRHKILNAFRVHQDSAVLSGKIELDEMLLPISYKGNHIKGDFNTGRKRAPGADNNLPRESYQRGSDNKSVSAKNKACVFCMTKNGSESFYAAVPGVGFMMPEMLDKTIGNHIDKEASLLLCDQYRVTKNYLDSNEYQYMVLAANTSDNPHDHKPEIRDGNHLQHVNAMHRHLRKFLSTYCGVSTKYLENYVSLYVWLKNISVTNKQTKHANKASISRVSSADCYITRKDIEALPAVPACA